MVKTIFPQSVFYPDHFVKSILCVTNADCRLADVLIARFFYREMQSNEETDQMRPEGQVSAGGGGVALVLRLNCAARLQLGAHFKGVSVT